MADHDFGTALQMVILDPENNKVGVNEESMKVLAANLNSLKADKVSLVSVMGAYRGGKSFILDIFLRYLRWEDSVTAAGGTPPGPREAEFPREKGGAYPTPDWLLHGGEQLEGVEDENGKQNGHGFKTKGGMDTCTEGVWIWSKPFLRVINGVRVALLVMDTQGAWDGDLTPKQSATIFGLTAVLSSKLIYNVKQQIDEARVENLAYFMEFARSALRAQAENENVGLEKEELERPFQQLEFLIRDWQNYKGSATMEECRIMATNHMNKFMNVNSKSIGATAETLQNMFRGIDVNCLPHPGLFIQREDNWSLRQLESDFVRHLDHYVTGVFKGKLEPVKILGNELTPLTFCMVVQQFVHGFQDAAPEATTFCEAMRVSTVLLVKESIMADYEKKMKDVLKKNKSGLDPVEFDNILQDVYAQVESHFRSLHIFGTEETRQETWQTIQGNLAEMCTRFQTDNARALERGLVGFAPIVLVAMLLFFLDRASDFTCDWWSTTCSELSKLFLIIYCLIAVYVGGFVYLFYNKSGKVSTAAATAELWKEMWKVGHQYSDRLMGKSGESNEGDSGFSRSSSKKLA